MIKIAFFVEGQSERIFIETFIDKYLAPTDKVLKSFQIVGDRLITITKGINYETPSCLFVIYDVGCDERVTSAINERAKKMFETDGFKAIIGIRDLYPKAKEDYESILTGFRGVFNGTSFANKVHLVVPIMEIEAWFIGDVNVFENINPILTKTHINQQLGIDIENDNIEDYPHPTVKIDSIFKLAGLSYDKHEHEVHSICSRIDFCSLCFDETYYNRVIKFKEFLSLFDRLTT